METTSMSRDLPRNHPANPLPWYDGGPVLSWLEYIAREQLPPIGVGIPGFLPCRQCGGLMVYDRDSMGGREWRTPMGEIHDCVVWRKHLQDHNSEYAVIYPAS